MDIYMIQLLNKLVDFFIVGTITDVVLFTFMIILLLKIFKNKIITRENNVEIAALEDKVSDLKEKSSDDK